MKKHTVYVRFRVLLIAFLLLIVGCSNSPSQSQYSGSTSKTYEARTLSKPAVVIFESRTCFACKELKPIIQKVSAQYNDKVEFIVYDLDNYNDNEAQEVANQFKVYVVPTLMFINKAGEVLHLSYGVISESEFQKYITTKLLGAPS